MVLSPVLPRPFFGDRLDGPDARKDFSKHDYSPTNLRLIGVKP